MISGMRLRVYAANGAALGLLPTPDSPKASYVLDDVGALQFKYPLNGAKVSWLQQPCEIAVELSEDGGVTWSEPDNSRFLYLNDGGDPLDLDPSLNITCKSYVWLLSKALVTPNNLLNSEGRRAFTSATPGTILKTFLNEANSLFGWLPGLVHTSFSSTTDSAGVAWGSTLTIQYEPYRVNLLQLLQDMSDSGLINFRMQGRTLQVYKADTALAVDRTVTNPQVSLRGGRDLTEAPWQRSWEALADDGFFTGDETSYYFRNTGAITPWGHWAMHVSSGNVKDSGTMAVLTQAALAQVDGPRSQYTHGLEFGLANAMPLLDYRPGDYVWSSVDGTLPTKMRVRQLTLEMDDKQVMSGNAVLGDRFLEADVRAQRKIDGITGSAAAGPGTGTAAPSVPDSEKPNSLAPAQVTGMAATSDSYMGPGGFPQTVVHVSWNAVTTNADGTPILDFDHYELYDRLSSDAAADFKAAPTENQIDLMGYQTGAAWRFKARAVDKWGNRGAFSSEVAHTTAVDAVAPQAPSIPTVEDILGQIKITWDGFPADVSAPSRISNVIVADSLATTTPKTSPVFDVNIGDIVVIRGYSGNAATDTIDLPTWTGTGTVTQRASRKASTGAIYIWTIAVTAAATGRTVTANRSVGTTGWGFDVTVVRNHGGFSQAPTAGLTVIGSEYKIDINARAQSLLLSLFLDGSGGVTTTVPEWRTGQVQDANIQATGDYPAYLGRLPSARLGTNPLGITNLENVSTGASAAAIEILATAGTTWPPDFDYVEVHASTINNFTPDTSTLVGRLYGAGSAVLSNLPFGIPVYAKLIAVDKGGLKSTASAQGTGTPHRIVGTDVDVNAITYEQLAFKEPGNIVYNGSFEDSDLNAVMIARSPIQPPWSETATSPFHGAKAIVGNGATSPSTFRELTLMTADEAQEIEATEKLFCRFAGKGSVGATGTAQLVVEWNRQGLSQTWSTVPLTTKDGNWAAYAAQLTAPTSVKSFRIYLEMSNDVTTGTYTFDAVEVRRTVNTSFIEDAAIINALIANATIQDAKIANVTAGKITAGTLSAAVIISGSIYTATSGQRTGIDSTGIRLYDSGGTVKVHIDPASGKLMLYSPGDVTHTSTAHAIQIGLSTGNNLALDVNEIMGRFNGAYGNLYLNREGGALWLGGKIGGFNPDYSDAGVFPYDDDHRVRIAANVEIFNARDGDYNDNYAPLIVGPRGAGHVWLDNDSIGSATATLPRRLRIQPPLNDGSHHLENVTFASDSLMMSRVSSSANAFLRGYDAGHDIALQFSGSALHVRNLGITAYRAINASAFTPVSTGNAKRNFKAVDALNIILAAPGRQWQYLPDFGDPDPWHVGPVAEDLPADLVVDISDVDAKAPLFGVDLGVIAGLAYEAVRQLAERVALLERRGPA